MAQPGTGLFWGSLLFLLATAFLIAVPVNRWLISRGRGTPSSWSCTPATASGTSTAAYAGELTAPNDCAWPGRRVAARTRCGP